MDWDLVMLRGKPYREILDPHRLARCVPNVLIVRAADPGLERWGGEKVNSAPPVWTGWYFDGATQASMERATRHLEQNGITFIYRRLADLETEPA